MLKTLIAHPLQHMLSSKDFLNLEIFKLKVNIRYNVTSSLGNSVKEEGLHSSKNGPVSTFLRYVAAIKLKMNYYVS